MFKLFFLRILVNIFGLYIVTSALYGVKFSHDWLALSLAGAILALVNVVIKPILVIFSLPALVFSLGLFMVFINGGLIYLTHAIYPHFEINSFGAAILAGMAISLLNYIVTNFNESKGEMKT